MVVDLALQLRPVVPALYCEGVCFALEMVLPFEDFAAVLAYSVLVSMATFSVVDGVCSGAVWTVPDIYFRETEHIIYVNA